MIALDTLSSGLLSYTKIPPSKSGELLDPVKRKLMENFNEYELAMAEIHQYFDLPLISYNYKDDMLILQIPINVKQY